MPRLSASAAVVAVGGVDYHSRVGSLDRFGVADQHRSPCTVGSLLDDLGFGIELGDHDGHAGAGLADGVECTIHEPIEIGLVGDDTIRASASRRIRCGRHEVEIRHRQSPIQSTQVNAVNVSLTAGDSARRAISTN